ncbi:hypothetical protein IC607_08530 [Cellulomonas sp. JH27-2]|uniref:hypothetical protein n=1 Tax=Cellulomonas sp. JH27-2 TaxID=2774139 RepID=UPI00178380E2|nr:hypothetical protein [Cellulomonas sp. JH27-2]MBD8059012.1 hypothetical protein [Cellulomonas sp. JH27-2]
MIIDPNPNVNTAAYAGYSVSHLREAGGEETLRFDAFVCLHGQRVMYVYNAGTGGSHVYQPVNEDWGTFSDALAAFEAYAADWNAGTEYAGLEDHDQLVNRLVEVATVNRRRTVMFLLDGESFWTSGVARAFRAGVTHAQAVEVLTGPAYAHRSPRIWSRQHGDFVPVVSQATEGQ